MFASSSDGFYLVIGFASVPYEWSTHKQGWLN
jgi:hypothetical protein